VAGLEGLRVGIVGGSIAGCSAAIELGRLGARVTVLERSRGELEGRGAGIGTPTATFDRLIQRDLIDPQAPRCIVSGHPLVGCSGTTGRLGHTALTLPLDMALINWGDLWRNLRRRVAADAYRAGREVTGIEPSADGCRLITSEGRIDCDLAIFADGYRSLGRSILFPDARLTYRGYVLWRGVLEETELSDPEPLEDALYRLHYRDLPGNAVFYFVPGGHGSIRPGERWVNWACYVPVPDVELPEFLTDREGRRHEASLPPGSMRHSEEERLKALMEDNLPPYFSEIIRASSATFAQPIYTVEVPSYASGRAALVGDAGSVAPPFTGSGVFKATSNAVDLAEALTEHGDVDRSLDVWSAEQTATGHRLAALGRQMEAAFVWSAPDFASMAPDEAMSWWRGAVTFPEDFSYVGDER
jgi:2-polyprenyl-6-methoxyphenol hydroxylase-like FAD-dependent oxidoreductase